MNRREALRALVAAGAAATTGACAERSRSVPPSGQVNGMTRDTNEGPEAITAIKALGPPPWPTRDPFLFCVHHDDAYPAGNERLGPASSLAGRNLGMDFEGKDGWRMYHGHVVPGFPQHPHRGFETVTVVRRGLLDHSDSLGAAARYGRGDVQWLTAGAGILHAEMFPLLDSSGPNPVELFQIWLNLPRANKFARPYFSMLWGDSIPRHVARDTDQRVTEVTLVAGRIGELVPPRPPPESWAAQAGADVAIWTIKMEPAARWELPRAAAGTNRTLYFFRGGSLGINGRSIPPSHLVELRGEAAALLENGGDSAELLLLQGRPINEPVVHYGPFVMSSSDEIRQAYLDYQRTRFGGWPWQGEDPVHPRQEGRFARHADGRIERPA